MITGWRLIFVLVVIGVVLTVIDFVWLSLIAKQFYTQALGDLLSATPNLRAAAAFYLMYLAGMAYFVVVPALNAGSWRLAILNGALFGLFTYGTYDLANLATLRDWPMKIVVVDMAWGTGLSASVGVISWVIARAVLRV